MLRERALYQTVEMNHSVWQNVLFPVTKWSMDPLFLHNMHCSLWYVLGSKCLALSSWQPKAALHTVHPLTVFFPPSCLNVTPGFFKFNLSGRCGVAEKFKISSDCKQAQGTFCNASPSTMLPNIDRYTKFNSWYGHGHFTGACPSSTGKPQLSHGA